MNNSEFVNLEIWFSVLESELTDSVDSASSHSGFLPPLLVHLNQLTDTQIHFLIHKVQKAHIEVDSPADLHVFTNTEVPGRCKFA